MTTEAATTASDILAMSDDEILNMEAPAIIAEEDTSTQNNPELQRMYVNFWRTHCSVK